MDMTGIITLIVFLVFLGQFAAIYSTALKVPNESAGEIWINSIRHYWFFLLVDAYGAVACLLVSFIGLIIYLLIIIVAGSFVIKFGKHQGQDQIQHTKKYVQSLLPANENVHYIRMATTPDNAQMLGGGNLNYMIVNDANHVVTFPESRFGNNKGYYLVNVDFTPKYHVWSESGGQKAYRTFFGDYDISGGSSDYYHREVPNSALLTFVPTDLSRSIKIKFNGETTQSINSIKQYYLLGQLEKQRLGLIK